MERAYTAAVAFAVDRPRPRVRQLLRALREAGIVPGQGAKPKPEHLAAIVFGLAAQHAKYAAAKARSLGPLPRATSCDLPITAADALARLIAVIPDSPVLGDLDLDDGFVRLGEASVAFEVLTLSGKRAVVRYGSLRQDIAIETVIPISIIRRLAVAVREVK